MAGISGNRANFDQSDRASTPGSLLPEPLPADPFPLFTRWFNQAQAATAQPNPNAMTLASVGENGRPAARIVLCKDIDAASGHIVFHTNYRGRKGRELERHPFAAAVFHWDALDRQARLEGPVERSPESESDAYFRSRPWLSRIGAWVSDQSVTG